MIGSPFERGRPDQYPTSYLCGLRHGPAVHSNGVVLWAHIIFVATYRMRLLSWMNGVKANSGIRMKNTRLWDPAIGQSLHPLPGQVMLLAPMDQHGPPEPGQPVAKCE